MKYALLAAAALATIAAVPAAALSYIGTYTSAGSPTTATLRFHVIGGSFVNVTGNIDGDVVTSFFHTATPVATPDGLFITDNAFSVTQPYLTTFGPVLYSAGGFEYNLFSDSATVYELYKAVPNVGYVSNSTGTFSIAAVPEPGTWAMLVAGFGLVGFAARRQKAVVAA